MAKQQHVRALGVLAATLVALLSLTLVRAETASPVKCAICQFVIKEVENIVEKNTTQAGLIALLDKVCTKAHLGDWCVQNVVPLVAELLQSIVAKADPAVVCTKIKLCSSGLTTEEMMDAIAAEDLEEEQALTVRCEVCSAIIDYVQKRLQGPATQEKVQALVTAACGHIPFARKVCVNIVAPTIANITVGLANRLSSGAICTAIHQCS